jgi:type II secretory pathway component PulK
MTRPLKEIAEDIRADWINVNYAASPYLAAMFQLNSIHDYFYEDTAASVVRYFLSNATGWRGQKAREIKQELRDAVKGVY